MLLYVIYPRRRWPQLSISIFDIHLSNRRHTGGLFLPACMEVPATVSKHPLYFHFFSKGHQWDPANNKWESTLLSHCIWNCPPMRYSVNQMELQERQLVQETSSFMYWASLLYPKISQGYRHWKKGFSHKFLLWETSLSPWGWNSPPLHPPQPPVTLNHWWGDSSAPSGSTSRDLWDHVGTRWAKHIGAVINTCEG